MFVILLNYMLLIIIMLTQSRRKKFFNSQIFVQRKKYLIFFHLPSKKETATDTYWETSEFTAENQNKSTETEPYEVW